MLEYAEPAYKRRSMIQVYLKNIQSIKEYTFRFPDSGIVQFRGDNNNGKSILTKVISRCVLQKIQYDDKRLPLINDGEESALFSMLYNERTLVVQLHKDVNKTFYGLIRANGDKVVRHIREGGITELLREFGFVVFSNNLICLQICETFGLMPFINTPDTLNGEIVNSVTTDVPSEKFIENYALTWKEAKRRVTLYKNEISQLQAKLDSTYTYDLSSYHSLIQRSKEVQEKHAYLKRCQPITLKPFPVLEFRLKKMAPLKQLPIITYLEKMKPLYSLDSIIVDLKKIRDGKCPTCGRPFLEGREHVC